MTQARYTPHDQQLIADVRQQQAIDAKRRPAMPHKQTEYTAMNTRPNILIRGWRWIFRTHWKEPVARNEAVTGRLLAASAESARDRDVLRTRVTHANEKVDKLHDRQQQLADLQEERTELAAKRYVAFEAGFHKSLEHGALWGRIHSLVDGLVSKAAEAVEQNIISKLTPAAEKLIERLVLQEFERRYPLDPLIEKLRIVMRNQGLAAEDLAAAASVTVQTARKWIAGTQPPDDAHRECIAELGYNTKLPTDRQLAGEAALPADSCDMLIERLREYLKQPGVLDRAVAAKVRVNVRTLYRWLAGSVPRDPARLRLACVLYGVPTGTDPSEAQLAGKAPLPTPKEKAA